MPAQPRKSTARRSTRSSGKTRGTKTAVSSPSKRAGDSRKRALPPKHRALSLHIGLNSVDPKHYRGWVGELFACEYDASDLAEIARSRDIRPTVLLTRAATRAMVLKSLRTAAKSLVSGDYFLLTYSGHGGQVPDVTGEEDDKKDETWCLYDGQLIDDELYLELGRFREGVRIFVVSDSCHSGTVVRAGAPDEGESPPSGRVRMMPRRDADRTYEAHAAFYDTLQRRAAKASGAPVIDPDTALSRITVSPRLSGIVATFQPSLILISGCQDNQFSRDGDRNGAFTDQLLRVWNRGTFTGNYARFHAEITGKLPPSQTPNLFTLGSAGEFLAQTPFQITAATAKRITEESARRYLKDVQLPRTKPVRRTRAMEATTMVFDATRTQAAVVGSDIVSFVTGVTPERREAIVNSSLLAQLVAKHRVSDPTNIEAWYEAYFDVLANVGWVVQDRQFAEYVEKSSNFEAHKAIMSVASILLGPATTALAIVKTTLDALQSMDESSPWLTIFNRESQEARTARFQISLAEQDADGQFMVTLMAFALRAKANITQVLFFKVRSNEAMLRHFSGRVTINTTVLEAVSAEIKAKVVSQASSYVSALPNFG